MELYNLLTVDPGKSASGWAYWEELNEECFVPNSTGVVRAKNWQEIIDKFHDILINFNVAVSFIESQEYFPSKAMAIKRGDIFTLSQVTGCIAATIYLSGGPFPNLIKPTTWKGQLSKEIVKERIEKQLSTVGCDIKFRDHETDAIGIGLFLLEMT